MAEQCWFFSTFQCMRTDTETVDMYDGGTVIVCPKHRSWIPALGRDPETTEDISAPL